VKQLAERLGAELVNDSPVGISAVGVVESAGENEITFITDDKHIAKLANSRAGAVIVAKGIDPTAKVSQNARLAEGVCVGPGVAIDDRVEIGANSVIGSGCKIG